MTGNKDSTVFLRHILSAIRDITSYMAGLSNNEFLADRKTQDAVIRQMEIIGEAAKNLPAVFRSTHPGVAWSEAARMRDKLIHGYFGVDAQDVWDTVQNDLPKLQGDIEKILADAPLSPPTAPA